MSLTGCKQSEERSNPVATADIIIYGGTSAAVSAAVEAKRSGKSVIVVSPDISFGRIVLRRFWALQIQGTRVLLVGWPGSFYHRVWQHYNTDEAWVWQKKEEYGNKGQGTPAMDGENRTMWIFEPHVAENVFEDFVREEQIRVDRDEWLDRENGVLMKDGNIVSITTLSGKDIFWKNVFGCHL